MLAPDIDRSRTTGRDTVAGAGTIVGPLTGSPAAHALFLRAAKVGRLCSFYLFQRHRHRHLSLEHVDGAALVILPEVFNPVLFNTGEMLARYVAGIPRLPQARVLDLGCGSGVVSIFVARAGAQVVATDINPHAVRCTRINALLHQVEDHIDFRQGDLFAPMHGEKFDLVLFNPPYFPGQPREPWERAWRSDDIVGRFVAGLPDVLAPGGRALVILSTVARGALETLQSSGLRVSLLAERQLFTERLSIVEVKP